MRYSQSGFVIVIIIHRKNDNVNSKNRKKTYYPNRHKSVRFMFCSSTNGSIIDYPGKNPNFNETLFSKFKIFRYNALSMASSVSSSGSLTYHGFLAWLIKHMSYENDDKTDYLFDCYRRQYPSPAKESQNNCGTSGEHRNDLKKKHMQYALVYSQQSFSVMSIPLFKIILLPSF